MVDLAVLGGWLKLMILWVFLNLNNSVILCLYLQPQSNGKSDTGRERSCWCIPWVGCVYNTEYL